MHRKANERQIGALEIKIVCISLNIYKPNQAMHEHAEKDVNTI